MDHATKIDEVVRRVRLSPWQVPLSSTVVSAAALADEEEENITSQEVFKEAKTEVRIVYYMVRYM
jgi:hypothetical protein